jgi:hypothetical protein
MSIAAGDELPLLWFRLLQPSRLPDWLAKARTAQRFGLYRENDPAALHAVTH